MFCVFRKRVFKRQQVKEATHLLASALRICHLGHYSLSTLLCRSNGRWEGQHLLSQYQNAWGQTASLRNGGIDAGVVTRRWFIFQLPGVKKELALPFMQQHITCHFLLYSALFRTDTNKARYACEPVVILYVFSELYYCCGNNAVTEKECGFRSQMLWD